MPVEHVFVDGRQVIRSGEPTLVDASIRSATQRVAEGIWERVAAAEAP